MIYLIGLIVWLEISLLFECWAMFEWNVEGPFYRFFCEEKP